MAETGNTRPGGGGWRRDAIWALIAVAVLIVAYLVGRIQGNTALAAQRQQTTAVRQQLAGTQALARLMGARGLLYRAANDARQANFGMAQSHLQTAAQDLSLVSAQQAGVDANALQSVQQQVSAISVQVSADTSALVGQIDSAVKKLDALLPQQAVGAQIK